MLGRQIADVAVGVATGCGQHEMQVRHNPDGSVTVIVERPHGGWRSKRSESPPRESENGGWGLGFGDAEFGQIDYMEDFRL